MKKLSTIGGLMGIVLSCTTGNPISYVNIKEVFPGDKNLVMKMVAQPWANFKAVCFKSGPYDDKNNLFSKYASIAEAKLDEKTNNLYDIEMYCHNGSVEDRPSAALIVAPNY